MRIDRLPFYWRLKKMGSPNLVPDYRPFEFDYIESTGLVIQRRDAHTLQYLEEVYKAEYNIGYLQDANEIAKPYGVDFMNFIERALGTFGGHVKNIIEIGCGGCTILSELQQKGYAVAGIDPSPVAYRDGVRKGIRIVQAFFPTPLLTEKADFIFHSDVLEHVAEPVQFLAHQKKQLNENGLLIISLPDCNEGINRGELSMAMHQHLNYFDNESLKAVVEAAGLEVLLIETAKYGGSLYCCARNLQEPNYQEKTGKEKYHTFIKNLRSNTAAITTQIKSKLADSKRQIGFYVPLRALPYLAILENFSDVRFFDDTTHWYNRAFDGTEIYIENFADLERKPVTDLFIMSLTFGETIRKKIKSKIHGIESITILKEMLLA